jgi:hypothetical protein
LGDKPFRCDVEGCDKAYTTAANLRLHQKRHEEKSLSHDESMEQEHTSGKGVGIWRSGRGGGGKGIGDIIRNKEKLSLIVCFISF